MTARCHTTPHLNGAPLDRADYDQYLGLNADLGIAYDMGDVSGVTHDLAPEDRLSIAAVLWNLGYRPVSDRLRIALERIRDDSATPAHIAADIDQVLTELLADTGWFG